MRVRAILLSALIGCGPTPPGETATDGSTAASTATDASSTSTTDPTTGASPPDLPSVDPEAACAAYCDKDATCSGVRVDPTCVENCVAGLGHGYGTLTPKCVAADAALVACFATLSCEVLHEEDRYLACDPELRAMLGACGLCRHGGGWVDPDTCYVDRLCADALLRVDCDADVCTCSVEGVVTEVCPSEGCIPEGFPATNLACCGVK